MDLLKTEISKKTHQVSEKIYMWSKGNERFLNVISPPYNSSYILLKTVLYAISEKKNILYVTNENIKENDILISIKKYVTYENCPFLNGEQKQNLSNFNVCNIEKMSRLKDKYDLIIFNCIRSFIDVNNENMALNLLNLINKKGKIIAYHFEKIFKYSREIVFPLKDNGNILIEPIFFKTKINLKTDIPQLAYEHINWSLEMNNKVIVYVPHKENISDVKNYLRNYFKDKSRVVSCFNIFQNNSKFEKMEKAILVTNRFREDCFNIDNINIMVLNANSRNINYKDIVYMCGRVSNKEKGNKGEVVLLAKSDNLEIDKAKSIIRNLNKSVWDMKLLKV
ncbi:hypothetical protein [Clostridium sp. DL1XJH146]